MKTSNKLILNSNQVENNLKELDNDTHELLKKGAGELLLDQNKQESLIKIAGTIKAINEIEKLCEFGREEQETDITDVILLGNTRVGKSTILNLSNDEPPEYQEQVEIVGADYISNNEY